MGYFESKYHFVKLEAKIVFTTPALEHSARDHASGTNAKPKQRLPKRETKYNYQVAQSHATIGFVRQELLSRWFFQLSLGTKCRQFNDKTPGSKQYSVTG